MTDTPPSPSMPSEEARILQMLTRIEERLDKLEQSLALPRDAAAALPGTSATVADMFDDAVDALADRGIDVDRRAKRVGRVLAQATEPTTLDAIERLLELAASIPAIFAATADTLDSAVSRLADAGIDVESRRRIVLKVAERLTAPEALSVVQDLLANVDAIRHLLDSGVFGPSAVDVVARAAHAMAQIDIERADPVGPLGALRAMRQPDVKRALGVLVAFGRSFGKSISTHGAGSSMRKNNGDQS